MGCDIVNPERELLRRKGVFRFVWWKLRVNAWLFFRTRGFQLPARLFLLE